MELFQITKDKVEPKPAALLIKEFKNIWDQDDKELALKELAIVYYLADYKSIYLSVQPEDREQVVIDDLFGQKSKYKITKPVLDAVKRYEELQETQSMRFLKSQRHALEELMKYFNSIDYRKIGRPKEVSSSMTETSKILESLEKIEERVKREISAKGRTKADREIGLFEDPE